MLMKKNVIYWFEINKVHSGWCFNKCQVIHKQELTGPLPYGWRLSTLVKYNYYYTRMEQWDLDYSSRDSSVMGGAVPFPSLCPSWSERGAEGIPSSSSESVMGTVEWLYRPCAIKCNASGLRVPDAFLILALLFWNHIFICDSFSFKSRAKSCRLFSVRYLITWNGCD